MPPLLVSGIIVTGTDAPETMPEIRKAAPAFWGR